MAGVAVRFDVADAGRLAEIADGSIDAIICNPPWGRAVGAKGSLLSGIGSLLSEWQRLLKPGGRIVALMSGDEFEAAVRAHDFRLEGQWRVSLFGDWPTIYCLGREGDGTVFDLEARFGDELRMDAATAW